LSLKKTSISCRAEGKRLLFTGKILCVHFKFKADTILLRCFVQVVNISFSVIGFPGHGG
jgi:hypothetical protein